MPTHKDFKRLVRRRMQKTGESYTTARAHLIRTPPPSRMPRSRADRGGASSTPPGARSAAKVDYAKLAGLMSDSAIQAATGCNWERWVTALDYVHAHEWPHRKIAQYVREKFEVPDWWSQAVTVGYERIRGLREIGQRRGGGFEASKSRTFPVPVSTLFDAFASARSRARWLPGIRLTVRKATPGKAVRITWHDGTSVEVWLTAKGDRKSSVSIQHRKLPNRGAVDRTKAFWAERLDSLEKILAR